jgi:hypothetical protein
MAELEVVRMVSDWLAYGVNGPTGAPGGTGSVNALLAGVPRDSGDAMPPSVTVYDSTRADWVARLKAPLENSGISFPALAVFSRAGIELDGEVMTTYRDGLADIAIVYVTQNAQNAVANVAALYTQRAILRSLKQFADAANYDAFRVRNSVAIRSCEKLRMGRNDEIRDGLVLSTTVIATYHVRDESV